MKAKLTSQFRLLSCASAFLSSTAEAERSPFDLAACALYSFFYYLCHRKGKCCIMPVNTSKNLPEYVANALACCLQICMSPAAGRLPVTVEKAFEARVSDKTERKQEPPKQIAREQSLHQRVHCMASITLQFAGTL